MIHVPDGSDSPPASVGGKAATWWRAFAAGLPVPSGFCIPAGARPSISELAGALVSLPSSAASLAVRSSGLAEDGAVQALAGLFDSVLEVPATPTAVAEALEHCRAAGQGPRVIAALGAPVEPGILVQEWVRPERSGLLFTRDPRGGSGRMLVEQVDGHLARLVEGAEADVRGSLLDEAGALSRALTREERDQLLRLAESVEHLLAGPADIEWASVAGRIILLQARPITTLAERVSAGLTLIPVEEAQAHRLPRQVLQHDKVALRFLAARLGIGISQGYIALASSPAKEDARRAALALSGWGELIAVLLDPFHLDGEIYRRFATGATAGSELARFVEEVGARHARFAFLLKELQETASTGVAVRMPDGGVHIELIAGHFITKGVEEATSYRLDAKGVCSAHRPGAQAIAVQVKAGRKERVPVTEPPCLRPDQLEEIRRAVLALSEHHPGAGIEFGHTPSGEFFLVDLYQGKGVCPPERENILSEGRIVGRVRILDLPDDALEQSIERHIHSARAVRSSGPGEPEILVVRRPYHLLDQWVYQAAPGQLGMVCEGGALLCHLAVVMRERGVPALVRPGALRELREGERVVLDTRPGSIAGITPAG